MDENCKISRWDLLKNKLNNLNPEAFHHQLLDTPNSILIDVRRPEEFATGALENAQNINYLGENFWEELDALDTNKTYFVYCRSGRRSIRTCTLMQNGGFKKVYNLDGGLKEWFLSFDSLELSIPKT